MALLPESRFAPSRGREKMFYLLLLVWATMIVYLAWPKTSALPRKILWELRKEFAQNGDGNWESDSFFFQLHSWGVGSQELYVRFKKDSKEFTFAFQQSVIKWMKGADGTRHCDDLREEDEPLYTRILNTVRAIVNARECPA